MSRVYAGKEVWSNPHAYESLIGQIRAAVGPRRKMQAPSGYVADGRVTPEVRAPGAGPSGVDDFIAVEFRSEAITLYLRKDDLYCVAWKFRNQQRRWIAAKVEHGEWDIPNRRWKNPIQANRTAPDLLFGPNGTIDISSPSCPLNYTQPPRVGAKELGQALASLRTYVPPTTPGGHPRVKDEIQRAVEHVAINLAEATRFDLVKSAAMEHWLTSKDLEQFQAAAIRDWKGMTKFLFNLRYTPGEMRRVAPKVFCTLRNALQEEQSEPFGHPVIVVFNGSSKREGEQPPG